MNTDKVNYNGPFKISFLFKELPKSVTVENVTDTTSKFFEKTTLVSADSKLMHIAIDDEDYKATYTDGSVHPGGLMYMLDPVEFQADDYSEIIKSQQWECHESDTLIDECKYIINVCDFMSAALPYKKRAELIIRLINITSLLYPDFTGIYVHSSEKFLSRDMVINNPYKDTAYAFLHYGINLRFFTVEESNYMVVDSLGMYALSLPDVEYYFENIDPNDIIKHAFSIAAYIYEEGPVIEDGHTVAGFSSDDKWRCNYEDAIVQPERGVLYINTATL